MNPIPVGLIGVGRHGSRYLRHLLTEETGGRLIAISRRNQEEGHRLAQEHHLRFYPEWRALLQDPALQAVIVAAPPTLHLSIALAAFKAGKALLLEKPLALDLHHGRQIVQAAQQIQAPLMIAHTLRYEPAIQSLQSLGESLGTWRYLSGTMRLERRKNEDGPREGWGPCGVLMEFGIHLLDLIRVLTKEEVMSVSMQMERGAHHNQEVRLWGSLMMESGLSCYLDISRVSQGRTTRLEIIGTEGQALADWTAHHISTIQRGNRKLEHSCQKSSTLVPLLRAFFHGLQTGSRMPITGVDGLKAVQIADACYRSAESVHPVSLQ